MEVLGSGQHVGRGLRRRDPVPFEEVLAVAEQLGLRLDGNAELLALEVPRLPGRLVEVGDVDIAAGDEIGEIEEHVGSHEFSEPRKVDGDEVVIRYVAARVEQDLLAELVVADDLELDLPARFRLHFREDLLPGKRDRFAHEEDSQRFAVQDASRRGGPHAGEEQSGRGAGEFRRVTTKLGHVSFLQFLCFDRAPLSEHGSSTERRSSRPAGCAKCPLRSSSDKRELTGPEISLTFVARARRCRCDKAHGPKERIRAAEGVVELALTRCRSGLREYALSQRADPRPRAKKLVRFPG